jgi:transcription antitermination factor NusG
LKSAKPFTCGDWGAVGNGLRRLHHVSLFSSGFYLHRLQLVNTSIRPREPLDMNTVQQWFALQTKPRSEKKVDNVLRQKGYECLTPIYRQRRKWSDRTVEIELPLFPSYVFCRIGPSVLGKAISTSGVIKIVGFNGKPAEVAIEEIEALQLLGQSNLLREPWNYLPNGTPVLVETGPLAGVQGIICADENKRQLIISVTLLQRPVAIQLNADTVISVIGDVSESRIRVSGESYPAVKLLRGTRI